MTKFTQRTTWCEDPFGEVHEPGKCPDCGASLRARGGHDYCWFCEKEFDGTSGKVFSPVTRDPAPKRHANEEAASSSRLADILEDKTPTIEGNIVFDDEDEMADGPDEGNPEAQDPSEDVDEFGSEEVLIEDEEEEVAEAATIEDDEPPYHPPQPEEDVGPEEDFEIEEPGPGSDESAVDDDEWTADRTVDAQDPEAEAEPEEIEEEWGTDDRSPKASDEDIVEELAFSVGDEEDVRSDKASGEEGGDEFVLDDVEEDDDDAESPYARGKKKKFVNVL